MDERKLVNLTNVPVRLRVTYHTATGWETDTLELEPDARGPARMAAPSFAQDFYDTPEGMRFHVKQVTPVLGITLPEPEPGVFFIVPRAVAEAGANFEGREDLVYLSRPEEAADGYIYARSLRAP